MIDNDILQQWSTQTESTVNHCPSNMMEIYPDEDMRRWSVQQVVTMLANADYYYTKDEVNRLIEKVEGLTPEQVQNMINQSIASKASKADLEAISAQVATNTSKILNTYSKTETNNLLNSYLTKIEANNMFANYSKVQDKTLILNSENIQINV